MSYVPVNYEPSQATKADRATMQKIGLAVVGHIHKQGLANDLTTQVEVHLSENTDYRIEIRTQGIDNLQDILTELEQMGYKMHLMSVEHLFLNKKTLLTIWV